MGEVGGGRGEGGGEGGGGGGGTATMGIRDDDEGDTGRRRGGRGDGGGRHPQFPAIFEFSSYNRRVPHFLP